MGLDFILPAACLCSNTIILFRLAYQIESKVIRELFYLLLYDIAQLKIRLSDTYFLDIKLEKRIM